ncbi:integrase [Sinorhizobium fredii]
MTDAPAAVNPLRRRMIDDMTLRNLSPATQRSYLHAVTKFSRYFGRSPDRLGLEDVRAFQVYLVSQGVSWPALNQTVCALRFFYGVTLDRAEIPERIAYARTPRKLPAILSADEVVRFLEAVPSLKARTALTTAYAAGLRASEAVSLKVADIDSQRMVIQVRHGKGAKDRTVMLSPQLLGILRTLLAAGAPQGLAVSRTGRQADRCAGALCRLPVGDQGGGIDQAGQRAHAAAQLCHPSARERRRYPHHSGAARTHPPVDDGALHPGGDNDDRPDREPARPAAPRGRAAGLRSRHATGAGGGGYLPPPWPRLSSYP